MTFLKPSLEVQDEDMDQIILTLLISSTQKAHQINQNILKEIQNTNEFRILFEIETL